MRLTKTFPFFLGMTAVLCGCASHYEITKIDHSRIIVDSTYDALPNDEAEAFIDIYQAKVDSIMSPVVGHTAKSMSSGRPESTLSNLLSDILVWAGSQYGEKPEFGVYNMGGIRATLPKGKVTFGNVLNVAPFENKICFLSLKGSDVKDLFRQMAEVGGEGVSSSVRLVISKDRKLISATIDGKEIDLGKTYRIATIDYLSEGNDKMTAFAKHFDMVSPKAESNDMRYIISNYFKEQEAKGVVVDANVEGRIAVK